MLLDSEALQASILATSIKLTIGLNSSFAEVKKTYISDTTIYEAIVAFRNRTIFDIFKSPIAADYDPIVKIIRRLTSSIDFINDESNKIFKDFNKDPSSLKDESRLKFFNKKLSNDLVSSMFMH